MALYAIGDLHFGMAVDKPMDIFGDEWIEHRGKIIESWKSMVTEEDTVIIAGDTSWAINMEEAMPDLEDISLLPGKKIIVKGNHDYWWTTLSKLNRLFEGMIFIQNSFAAYEDYAVCGSRGWLCPNDYYFTSSDEKIYRREINRLRIALEGAKAAGYKKLIVATHYPPTNDRQDESEFTRLYEEFGVEKVVYGHLHGKEAFKGALRGERNGVEYIFAACDYTGFKLVKIL
ncbi:MAG: serine/threonine protein phosphatase [Peptoclostridium sp.]|uniref:metallophosphoesterase n=1 Tax=Peptoclostridium sp. TaxID=1904860 RepID=UPI00139EDAFE|nr:metallophosphoesterase [Peptoclostridium sp.]MZQ75819.1 serine/threonine protein phosphatase [Peptoclostridium sp.]